MQLDQFQGGGNLKSWMLNLMKSEVLSKLVSTNRKCNIARQKKQHHICYTQAIKTELFI